MIWIVHSIESLEGRGRRNGMMPHQSELVLNIACDIVVDWSRQQSEMGMAERIDRIGQMLTKNMLSNQEIGE
jgi:hypothetical protein